MRKIIVVNFDEIESVKKGEIKKTRLENQGYNLVATTPISFTKYKMVYEK
jgi:hypothetical protein